MTLGFDQVQVRVDLAAIPTRSTDAAADAARIILETALRSRDGVTDVLVVDNSLGQVLFKELTRRIGSRLLIGSGNYKNPTATAERVNWAPGDTQRAFANGRRTTGTLGCPTPSSRSTMQPRCWAAS